jgi:hypothetical protein
MGKLKTYPIAVITLWSSPWPGYNLYGICMPKDIFRLTSSQSGTYQEHDLSGIALRVPHVEQELLTTFRSTILFCEANVKFYLMAFVGHWKFEDTTGLFKSRKSMAKRIKRQIIYKALQRTLTIDESH